MKGEYFYIMIPTRLLSINNSKLIKGESFGYLSAILNLMPYNSFDRKKNLCPFSTTECREICLGLYAGHPAHRKSKNSAMYFRTALFINDLPFFMNMLEMEILQLKIQAHFEGKKLAIRLNGSSDICWEKISFISINNIAYNNIMQRFSDIQFYDYTKDSTREFFDIEKGNFPENYHLTFSFSGHNWKQCHSMLKRGFNVSVVFENIKKNPMPEMFEGFPVVTGDSTDLRFLDGTGKIIGLNVKGTKRKHGGKFVK